MALSTAIVEAESDIEDLRPEWDRLAVEAGQPLCAPGWMLAWWRHGCAEGAGLRAVAVWEGDRLLGVAPLWAARARASRSDYQMLADRLAPPAGPLAVPGREREVAEQTIDAIAGGSPKPATIRFWCRHDPAATGDRLVEAAARRGFWVHRAAPVPLPIADLSCGDFERWFAARGTKFRKESRRRRRRLEDTGARVRLVAGIDEAAPALDAFVELHDARWRDRGGSNALIPGLRGMLAEATDALLPSGRLRIFTLAVDGRAIAVNILLAAGEEVSGWSSGFDVDWYRYSPSIQLALAAIEDASERGERQVCLGPGETDYKRRLADRREEIAMTTLVPRGGKYPLTRLRLAPYQARASIAARLSPHSKRRLRRLLPGGRR
ncbi:MAG TPA: GNAT family N-acetyltransferase [Solirubrobacterales bacterium]|nr:GNAT family N-acetyltransferase [Solirubrobacterales bacterium]